MVDQYAREVEDFRFLPLKEEWGKQYSRPTNEGRRLRVTIGINGWLTSQDDVTKPWRVIGDESEVFALRYEMNHLLALGRSLKGMVSSTAWSFARAEILRRTVLASLWSALWPAYLLSIASSIDNPFSLARNRSEKAGRILADALINKVQGERPVTLVGYSLGARVIYACLRSLVTRRAFGLVENVIFIGAPMPANREQWLMMRSVVSGKIHNVYSENDLILAFVYRATSVQLGVAGLQAVKDIEGVENIDLSREVQGHLRYPELIDKILTRCGFPNIKGGSEPIEADDDAISLEDADQSQMGTLIDFGDLNISEAPKPTTRQENKEPGMMMSPRQPDVGPRRLATKPIRATTSDVPSVVDPLGADASEPKISSPVTSTVKPARMMSSRQPDVEPRGSATTPAQANTRDVPKVQDPLREALPEPKISAPVVVPAQTKYEPAKSTGPLVVERPSASHEHDEDEDEYDDEDYVGIQMEDHDDDFADMVTIDEPMPIED
jgi:hypothetical protein